MAAEPQKAKIFSTNSGAINFLNGLQIPVPLGIYEIYDKEEMISNLANLMKQNIDTDSWIFKIDGEFNGNFIK